MKEYLKVDSEEKKWRGQKAKSKRFRWGDLIKFIFSFKKKKV